MNARTIDELGAMAAARRQLEMLPADQRAEVLREDWMVRELYEALAAIRGFGDAPKFILTRCDAVLSRFGGAP